MNNKKGDEDMTINHLSKISELKAKAKKRKVDANLRHIPNKSDLTKANENAQLLQPHQYRTFEND